MVQIEGKMIIVESEKLELKNQLYLMNEKFQKLKGKSTSLYVELEEKLEEINIVFTLEKNKTLEKDIAKLKDDLPNSLKWKKSSKLFSNVTNQSNYNKRGLGNLNITPPFNPHSKYVFVSDNLLCVHCGRNGHLKSDCTAWRESHEILSNFTEKKRI